ncbi:SNF1-related protein kinase regulatory subunit beta-2 [Gracilariopsis chorda]|uniref:SNF1-related protein kinase regulatory subunit beta-2 n=1 Tax=Gracilariopsis chorda TaxID=448386 RepID=A0A2V3J069_9FLOR|nr:SNF1-related protein kinase regulatory subunit beta-2 [Gracilariopsis chorda]|eukprot:PXF47794.1 SNF1-related protein kinase regulatory subunit beta-2 [Gracilariopsis chorda]
MNLNTAVPVTIEYFANDEHRSVAIKGSWDNWHSLTPLQRNQHESTSWHVDINLNPGVFLFKFIVDDHWQYAPNYKRQSDNFGGYNNVLHVLEEPQHETQPTHDNLPQSEAHLQATLGSGKAEPENRDNHKGALTPSHLQSHIAREQSKQLHSSLQQYPSDSDNSELQTPHNTAFSEQEEQTHSAEFVDALSQQVSHMLNASSKNACDPKRAVVSFVYHVDARHADVSVKGSWDQWQKQLPLVPSEHGYWHSNTALPPGSFLFKFVVDGKWTHSTQYEVQSDGFGGYNNVINVKESECGAEDGQLVSFISSLTAEPVEDHKPIGEQSGEENERAGQNVLEAPRAFSETSSNPNPFEAEVEGRETIEHTVLDELVPSSEIHEMISSDRTPQHDPGVPYLVERDELEGNEMQLRNTKDQGSRNGQEESWLPIQTPEYDTPDPAKPVQDENAEREVDHPRSVQDAQVRGKFDHPQTTQTVQVDGRGDHPQTTQIAQAEEGDNNLPTTQVAQAEEENHNIQTMQAAQATGEAGHPPTTVGSVTETRETDEDREEHIDEDDTGHQTEPIASFAAPLHPEKNEQDNHESDGEESACSSTGKAARDHDSEFGDHNVAEPEKMHSETGMSVSESNERVPVTSNDERDCSVQLREFDSSRMTYAEYSSTTSMQAQEESSDGDIQTDKLKQILQGKLMEDTSDVDLDDALDSVSGPSPRRKESRGCTMC